MPAYSNSCRRCPVPWPKYGARHRRSRCRCSAGCACGISWPAQKCYRPKACGSRLHPWLFPPGLAVKPSNFIRIPHPVPGCKGQNRSGSAANAPASKTAPAVFTAGAVFTLIAFRSQRSVPGLRQGFPPAQPAARPAAFPADTSGSVRRDVPHSGRA